MDPVVQQAYSNCLRGSVRFLTLKRRRGPHDARPDRPVEDAMALFRRQPSLLLSALLLLAAAPAGAAPALLPVVAYMPETGAIGGAWLQWVTRQDSLDRPDQLAAWATLCARGQAELGLRPELWRAGDRLSLLGELSYQHWPASWHGIGPDSPSTPVDFTVERVKLELRLRRRLTGDLWSGVHALGSQESFTKHDPAFAFANDDGRDLGLGAEVAWDIRDDTVWPGAGWLAEGRALRHGSWLGGRWDYSRWQLDLRRYQRHGPGVLAVQAALEGRGGAPSFRTLPRLGEWLRAVEDMRFQDRWAAAARLEWRQDLPFTLPTRPGRWLAARSGFVCFVEAGQVGARGCDLAAGPWKSSLGLGGRFALLPGERLNARADLAYGVEGVALRIKVGEEF
jgi:hypothetical protein